MQPSVKSPGKEKLRKTILRQRSKINCLKKKVNPKKKSKVAVEDAVKGLETFLPASLIKLIESQVGLFSTPSKNGYRYSSELKAFAVTQQWLNKLPNSPGLTEPAMNVHLLQG